MHSFSKVLGENDKAKKFYDKISTLEHDNNISDFISFVEGLAIKY